MAKKFNFPPAYTLRNFAIFLIPSIILFILSQLPSFLDFQKCLETQAQTCSGNVNLRAALLYQMLIPVLGVFWLKITRKYSWKDFGLQVPRLSITMKYVGVGILFITLIQLIISALGIIFPVFQEQQFVFSDKGILTNAWPFIVMAVLGAPIVEEIAFRGFEFSIVGRHFGIVFGAIVSSLTFGFAHGQVAVFFATFLMGLYLCYSFIKTKSIVPGIILHCLNNVVGVWLLLF